MILDGDGLLVEVRLRVVGGVLAVRDRHRAEITASRTRQVHVALGDHRHLRRRCRQPVRVGERIVDPGGVRILDQSHLHLAEPHPGALVESAVCHNAIRDSGGHCDGCLLNGGAGGAATVVNLGEELQVPDTGGPSDGNLGIRVHRERCHAVDVGGREARIRRGHSARPPTPTAARCDRSSWRNRWRRYRRSRPCRDSSPGIRRHPS